MKYVLLLAVICGASCCGKNARFGDSVLQDDELFPTEWKHPNVTLSLGGVDIPSKVELRADGEEREVKIYNGEVMLESELYIVKADSIAIKRFGPAGGETYDPPLTLVNRPMRIGEPLEWSGTYNVADRKVPATAKIESSVDQLQLATGAVEAIRCQVELLLDDGSKQNVKRSIIVWFAKELGPIKRDFGKQVRAPRADSASTEKK